MERKIIEVLFSFLPNKSSSLPTKKKMEKNAASPKIPLSESVSITKL